MCGGLWEYPILCSSYQETEVNVAGLKVICFRVDTEPHVVRQQLNNWVLDQYGSENNHPWS